MKLYLIAIGFLVLGGRLEAQTIVPTEDYAYNGGTASYTSGPSSESIIAPGTIFSSPFPQGIEHVIVVGVDGMSPDGIRTASTPVMHQLIATGSVKWNVRTVLPSSSSPNWASMIMGGGTELHGITDNDWGRADYTLPPIVSDSDGLFPTIFEWVRRSRPDAEIGAVYQWDGFERLFERSAVNYDQHEEDGSSTAAAMCAYITSKHPTFAFMHLDFVDDAGHEQGHGTPAYYQAVSKADSLIGKVYQAVKDAGMESSTLFIVTADHGGVGYGHGGATVEEAEIAMILHGPSVKQGYNFQQQVYTYDLAATIAFGLQIVPPYAWTGRPIKPAFVGFSEPENLYLGKMVIPSPKLFPGKYLYKQAGGLYVDSSATVSLSTVADSAVTRYTTDGSFPTAASALYTAPFRVDTTTVVTARSFDARGNASEPAVAYYRIVHSGQGHGLKVSYYPGGDWNTLPVFAGLQATQHWTSYEFILNRDQIDGFLGKDPHSFATVFEGYVQIDHPGDYTFFTRSDDGSRLFVDGKAIVNNDGDHGVLEKNEGITLTPGRHPIRVEYYNGEGGFWLDVLYRGPGVPKQLIPADKLYLSK